MRIVRKDTLFALILLALTLLALRVSLWSFANNYDMVLFFGPLETALATSRWHALVHPLKDYFPAYYEAGILSSYLPLARVAQIKIIPFLFDVFAAGLSYSLVSRVTPSRTARVLAPFVILAGPTVILNSSVWGQCDIIYTFFLMATTLAVIVGSGALAMLMFGFGLAFKLQTVFLLPFLAAMYLQKRIRWWHVLFAPVGWILSLVPVAMVGGHLWDFARLPLLQTGEYAELATDIGNPWMVLQWTLRWIHRASHQTTSPVWTGLGMVVTMAAIAGLAWWGRRFKTSEQTLILASLSLAIMPYIMPKMHDRYFLPAEVFLGLTGCVAVEILLPNALIITGSLLSYANYFLWDHRKIPLVAATLANTAGVLLVLIQSNIRLEAHGGRQRNEGLAVGQG